MKNLFNLQLAVIEQSSKVGNIAYTYKLLSHEAQDLFEKFQEADRQLYRLEAEQLAEQTAKLNEKCKEKKAELKQANKVLNDLINELCK